MISLRLAISRAKNRFLGAFSEVRYLRRVESAKNEVIFSLQRENAELSRAKELLTLDLEQSKRGLEVMTEARMNMEREIDTIRGQIDTVREISQREIHTLKQTVDWMSLECGRRQVFGTAPQAARPVEEDSAPAGGKMTARMLSRELTAKFMAEAEEYAKRGDAPPANGPKYSSTQRFSTTSFAVNGG